MIVCSLCRRCYDDSVASCNEPGHPLLSETYSGNCEMIGGYRLEHLLESKSGTQSFRARQLASGRSCRIRIYAVDLENSEDLVRQAQAAAALFHPNVVDVFETGRQELGEVFVVAEDPEGESLRDILNAIGVPPLLTSIQVVRQTAEALHTLHLKGLIHRAVAPENIIVTSDFQQNLLVRIKDPDLGGFRQRSIFSNKFLIDHEINSLKYFAPEQCEGGPASVKTDVYGLGVVLYEMLAGVPPFVATKAAELIEKHKNERPPEIKIDNFDLRMLLYHTLMESLHKRPDRRQGSADAFARQMRHIEQLATHVSTPAPAVTMQLRARTPITASNSDDLPKPHTIMFSDTAVEKRTLHDVPVNPPFTLETSNESILEFEDEGNGVNNFVNKRGSARVADTRGLAYELLALAATGTSVEKEIEARVNQRMIVHSPRASRLRAHRRKLHPRTALTLVDSPSSVASPTSMRPVSEDRSGEPAGIEIACPSSETEEAPMVLSETAPGRIDSRRQPNDISCASTIVKVLVGPPKPIIELKYDQPAESTLLPGRCTKIAWDQPEEDIPTEEVVLEVLSKEQNKEVSAENYTVADVGYTVSDNEFRKSGPQYDCSGGENRRRDHLEHKLKEVPRGQPETPPVLPRLRPAYIEWEDDTAGQGRPADEKDESQKRGVGRFAPTILGIEVKDEFMDFEPEIAMFSAKYSGSDSRFSAEYRLLTAGLCGLALLAAVLFGTGVLPSISSQQKTDGSFGSITINEQLTMPRTGQTAEPVLLQQDAPENFTASVPDDRVTNGDNWKPLPPSPTYKVSNEEVQINPTKARIPNVQKKMPEADKKTLRSTRKVTSEPNTTADQKLAEPKPPVQVHYMVIPTRPRIVKNPVP